MDSSLYLYIHIPFCLQKCHYCDFATLPSSHSVSHLQYINSIQKELHLRGQHLKKRTLHTIYLGGGTPSVLSSTLLEKLLSSIHNFFNISKDIEITIEINPGTVDQKKLDEYLSLGINRFSVGVQTFSDSLLKLCGRKHSSEDSKKLLSYLNKRNLNFSCDLLFALPKQDSLDVCQDLEQMLFYSPPHISTYCLTIPSGHPLQQNRPQDAAQINMFKNIEEALLEKNYIQYEISNFSRPNKPSKHNQAYWNDKEYWGLGLSAHSFLKSLNYGIRFWNSRNIQSYMKQLVEQSSKLDDLEKLPFSYLPSSQMEILSKKEALSDFCHTALRTNKGIIKTRLSTKFGPDSLINTRLKLQTYIKNGLIEETHDSWCLNFRGRMLSNQIFYSLI